MPPALLGGRAGTRAIGPIVTTAVPAAGIFWLAYDGGGYTLSSYTSAAIAVLWALLVGAATGLLPVGRMTRPALAVSLLLAAFAGLAAASAFWGANAEATYAEFARAVLYLAVFALVAVGITGATSARLADGLAIGISAVSVLSLATRFFPGLIAVADVRTLLPTAFSRLSYPLGYWNGLAIFAALGCPLLLRAAASARSAAVRGAAVAPLPALAAVVFLASSRGGAATALLGTVLFVVLTGSWSGLVAALVGAAGSAAAIALVHRWPSVIDLTPTAGSAGQGHRAALAVAACCLASGVLFALLSAFVRLPRPGRGSAVALAATAAIVVLAAVAVSHPVRRLDDFRAAPIGASATDVQNHLLSSNGSGRWQFWSAASAEFHSRPAVGRGAGSFEAWWARHGSLPVFVRDAHSLYLEQLGELGFAGLALLGGAFVVGAGAGVLRLRRSSGAERAEVAAFLACFIAYAFAAAVDWVWELPAVSVVGFACLALLAGPTSPGATVRRGAARVAVRCAAAVGVLALIAAEAIPLAAEVQIGDSQAAVRRGDWVKARSDALRARDVEPWASTPYLQLALVAERAGSLPAARGWIAQAIAHDRGNWRLWLIRTRLETEAEAIGAARRSLAVARSLDPRSPLFTR